MTHIGRGLVMSSQDYKMVHKWLKTIINNSDPNSQKQNDDQIKQLATLIRYSLWPSNTAPLSFMYSRTYDQNPFQKVREEVALGKYQLRQNYKKMQNNSILVFHF